MVSLHRFDIQSLEFLSDGTTKRLSIDGPHPGNWFAVAFLSWTDPNNDRIEQQGEYSNFVSKFFFSFR